MSRLRKVWVGVAIACTVLGCAAFALKSGLKEPEYQGKKLSEWVELYCSIQPVEVHLGAADAIRNIGTNAIPFLLADVKYEAAPWRDNYRAICKRLPFLGQQLKNLDRGYVIDTRLRLMRACGALGALGPLGLPAIPQLTQWIKPTNSTTRRLHAATALGYLGPDALPALREAFADRDGGVSRVAEQGLKRISPEGLTNAPAR